MWHVFRNRIILRTMGIVLMCVSVVAMGAWFLWLLPAAQRYDPVWAEKFTRKAEWKEIQKQIRRHGWTHDSFGAVGSYGDKSWAAWIMSQAEAGRPIATCGDIGHKDEALKYITCSDPAPGTNYNTETQWLSWWQTNKNKSQLDWIRAGLRTYGVPLHLPPSEADYEPLLALLGNKSTNETERIPTFVKYNAFRWLRDSGFEVLPFALSNVTVETPALVRGGILEYGKYERSYRKEDGVGRLELASPPPDVGSGGRPYFFRPAIQFTGYGLMTVPFLLGTALLVYSCRQRTRGEQGSQAVCPPGPRTT